MIENEKEQNIDTNNPFSQEINGNIETVEATPENQEQPADTAELDAVKAELESYKNQYLRMAADFDNYRKRQAEEREALVKYAAEDTLKKLLPVLDTFDRAKKSVVELSDADKVKESFEVVYKQFADTLDKIGVQKIETAGNEFDPQYHEAVMQTPTSEHSENVIINELQSGYKLGDRVIRPALVNVAVSE